MNKMDGYSMDLKEQNIKELQRIFPEVVKEGKVDFEKLRLLLGENIEKANERYEFTWNGKTEAIKIAQTPSLGTLLPDKESSKDFDTTQNLYIEGDNLEVLKLLQKSYFGKIKMIYIDPPYNTGNDFVYKDDYRDNIKNYKEITNQTTRANPETSGRYHTDWLNMMYPRLKLARNLLTEDGVIFISIDDNEVANLKKICDEIFGEENFVEIFSWTKTDTPSNLGKKTKKSIEYIICYQKVKNSEKFYALPKKSESDNPLIKSQNSEKILFFKKEWIKVGLKDGYYSRGLYGTVRNPVELLDDFKVENGKLDRDIKIKAKFVWTQEKLEDEVEKGTEIRIKTDTMILSYEKKEYEAESPWNIIDYRFNVGTNEDAEREIRELFGKKVYDYPKPTSLLKYLLLFSTNSDSIILDFFSGSATTAHAVMQLNAEDGGNRRFIMVQLPEATPEDSEARKAGYKNICEIGKERIRRAGEKIKKETGRDDLDIGFKVFKLDYSNIKIWNPNYDDIKATLLDMKNNIVEGRTKEDVLYEIILKLGLDLTTKIEEIEIYNKKLYRVADGALIVCLEDEITIDLVKQIPSLVSEFMKDDVRIVFLETAFSNRDSLKLNIVQTLKQLGIKEENIRSV